MDWIDLPFFKGKVFNRIVDFLDKEKKEDKTILPERGRILHAMALTPFRDIKVVVIGQDPYPNKKHAMGLAFAIRHGTDSLPKSLANIFRELEDDIGKRRTDGDLSDWAKQGVLLLNTSLTVVEGKPGSHSEIGWKGLIRNTIEAINEELQNVVFVLWGGHAQKLEMYIDQRRHHVIKSPHPSPLSAYRGFFGSKPFSKVNKILEESGKEPILWQ